MLDDDARLDDRAVAVDQHGELGDRPQAGEILPRTRLLQVPTGERRPVLPPGDEDLLAVGGEGVGVEGEGHWGLREDRR
jgi:hypothetical protein